MIVLGSVSVYERSGQYQLYAREIMLDGAGALYEKFEALKKELAEMGMFAREYKQPIPKYIHTLGVVTAPTGAAVRDIINIAGRGIHMYRSFYILHRCRGKVPRKVLSGESVHLRRKK